MSIYWIGFWIGWGISLSLPFLAYKLGMLKEEVFLKLWADMNRDTDLFFGVVVIYFIVSAVLAFIWMAAIPVYLLAWFSFKK